MPRFVLPSVLLLAVFSSPHAQGQDHDPARGAAAPASLYDATLGEWTLTARSMRPDQTLNEGTGDLNVYLIHDGQTIQADMRVAFADGTGFTGSTMRTFIEAEAAWAVTWVAAGQRTAPSGTGFEDGDRMVETFPGSDPNGSFTDTLILSGLSDSHFVVRMDRQYEGGGPLVEGVWQYEATRR